MHEALNLRARALCATSRTDTDDGRARARQTQRCCARDELLALITHFRRAPTVEYYGGQRCNDITIEMKGISVAAVNYAR